MKENLPALLSKQAKSISNVITSGAKLVGCKAQQLSPHIKIVVGIVVDSTDKKSNYGKDLKFLVRNGVPVKVAAEKLGMSVSYAYKLLKKK